MNGISDEKTRNFRNEIIILEKQGSTINEHDLYCDRQATRLYLERKALRFDRRQYLGSKYDREWKVLESCGKFIFPLFYK